MYVTSSGRVSKRPCMSTLLNVTLASNGFIGRRWLWKAFFLPISTKLPHAAISAQVSVMSSPDSELTITSMPLLLVAHRMLFRNWLLRLEKILSAGGQAFRWKTEGILSRQYKSSRRELLFAQSVNQSTEGFFVDPLSGHNDACSSCIAHDLQVDVWK